MCNVVLDVKAGAGHAFRYQGAGASIWSGEDWHVNDSGLMVAETSLSDGAAGNPRGVPLFVRVRRAIQYDASITGVVKTLRARYNGGYPGEWLIGDAKTGEIASLQLGRRVSDLRRTRRGFYDSSNWATGPNLRREARAPQPSLKNGAYARYVRWGQLWALEHGRIDAEVVRIMLADHRDVYLGRAPRVRGPSATTARWTRRARSREAPAGPATPRSSRRTWPSAACGSSPAGGTPAGPGSTPTTSCAGTSGGGQAPALRPGAADAGCSGRVSRAAPTTTATKASTRSTPRTSAGTGSWKRTMPAAIGKPLATSVLTPAVASALPR